MKIKYRDFIYESVIGFIKDDRLLVDISKITPTQYTQINNRLKGEGYDVRGPNDIKKILESYKKEVIDGIEYTRIGGSDDWPKIIGNVLKITKPEKLVKDKNVLSYLLKNVAKDKDSGISIGEYISSATAYILPDGKTINFRTSSNGIRGDDHRYIVSYLKEDFTNGTDGMYYFMDNTGAIRFIPESPAFDLRSEPTNIQLGKIEKFVDTFKGGEIGVDLYSRKFGRKGKFYPSGTRGARVKADILRFYGSGETGMDFLHESIAYNGYIYREIILEAYTAADIDRVYGNLLNDYVEKNYDLHKTYGSKEDQIKEIVDIKKTLIRYIVDVDPSTDKKYLGAITKWVLEKRPEDLDTQIKEYLSSFKKLLDLNPGKFGSVSKEISKGRYSLDQLKTLINDNSELLGKNKNTLKIEDKVGDFKKIGENDNYVCYLIDEWVEGDDNKHICFQGDVDWCVKYTKHFNDYGPPYYYFLDKSNGKEFALMHVESLQLKDIRDNPLNKNDFLLIKDIIVNILRKQLMPYKGVDYGETDFSVVIENLNPEEFNEIFHNITSNLISQAIDHVDTPMINALFNSNSASELLKKALEIKSESDIIQDVKWLIRNSGHILYRLSDTALKGLMDEFWLDEEDLFKEIVHISTYSVNRDRDNEYNRKNQIAKWMIEDGYVNPTWKINIDREELTPLEMGVMLKNIGAVEASLANPETDQNTMGLDSAHKSYGVTPLYYLANLTDYERDVMFKLLVNDPRTNVNAYSEDFNKDTNTYHGRSVLDLAPEDRKEILISKGAKPYNELTNTLKASAGKYR